MKRQNLLSIINHLIPIQISCSHIILDVHDLSVCTIQSTGVVKV